MIQVSTNGRYALRLMLDLVLNQQDGPVLREDIARRQGVSADYTAQLFRKLNKAGLARGVMGPGGGYLLGRDPVEILIGDVIRATEGPISLVRCVYDGEPSTCERTENCVARLFWIRASRALEQFLDSTTLADLAKDTLSMGWIENDLLNPISGERHCA